MASFFQKAGQPQVQTTTPTPMPGAEPLWRQLLQSATTGAGAVGGNAADLQKLMNPLQSILQPFFQRLRQQAVTGSNASATLQGGPGGGGAAFDSTRAAAMAGSELAGVDQQEAGLTYQNATDALNRGLQLGQGIGGMALGQTQTVPTEWSPFATLAGLAMEPFAGGTGLFGLYHPPQPASAGGGRD